MRRFLRPALRVGLLALAVALTQSCDPQGGPTNVDDVEPPEGIQAVPTGPSSTRLTWTPLERTDVRGYRVSRRANLTGGFEVIGEASADAGSYADVGLEPETFYGYRLEVLLSFGGVSQPSAVAGVRTAPAPGIFVQTPTDAPNVESEDPDGYVISLHDADGELVASEVLAADGNRRFPVDPGVYTVSIGDVAETCSVGSPMEQTVTVVGTGIETVADVVFDVSCKDPTRGEIQVDVGVTGDFQQQEPFRILVTGLAPDSLVFDGSDGVSPSGGSTTFANLVPGDYSVEVSAASLSNECVVTAPLSAPTISVGESALEVVSFQIECLSPLEPGLPLRGLWTDAAGTPISTASVGDSVYFDVTAELGDTASLQAMQGNFNYLGGVLRAVDADDLDLGSDDNLTEFASGVSSIPDTAQSFNFQTFSLSSSPNSGDQGIARVVFVAVQNGRARVGFSSQVGTVVDFAGQPKNPVLRADPLEIGGTATPAPPIADAGGPYSGEVDASIAFNGSGSRDPDGGALVSYSWAFGDGANGSGANATHAYAAEGTYTVVLTVVDDEDEVGTDTTTVQVVPAGSGGGGGSETAFGGWTDLSGNPIDSIGVGDSAILELCSPEQTQALQTLLVFDRSLATLDDADDYDSSASNVSTCLGTTDVLTEFTSGSLSIDSVNFQSLSISAGAGTGPQGYALLQFTATAAGVLRPEYGEVLAWGAFDGSPQPSFVLPPLAIDVPADTTTPPPPPPPTPSPPVVDAGGPYADTTGATVAFSGTATGDVDSVLWDFGDGDTATSTSATNVYDTAGVYTATFTATGPGGSSADTTTVTISDPAPPPPPPPPPAELFAWKNEWTPTNGNPAELVTLSAWTNPGEPIQVVQAKVDIDPLALELVSFTPGDPFKSENGGLFGNVLPAADGVVRINARAGSIQPSGVPVMVASFTYRVVGSLGTSAGTTTDSLRIGVSAPFLSLAGLPLTEGVFDIGQPNQPPTAMASASVSSVTVGGTVPFSAAGSQDPDGTVTTYSWDFGDGNIGTGPAPAHTYEASGSYTALLTVTDDRSATDTASVLIQVTDPATFAWRAGWQRPPSGPTTGPARAPLQTESFEAPAGSSVELVITALPGTPVGEVLGTIKWPAGTLRLDGVRAGAFATQSFTTSPISPSVDSLAISAIATTADPGTSAVEFAIIEFAVNSSAGTSITTTSDPVELRDGSSIPLDLGALGLVTLETTLTVIEPGPAPLANAGGPYDSAPGVIQFDGSGSTGGIDTYLWDFGGGNTGTGVSPTFNFPTEGTFDVSLTVTGTLGSSTDSTTVTITVTPPTASAGGPYQVVDTATAVTFDASGSTQGTNPIASYEWDFGDGTAPVTTSSATINHNYAAPGTFNVSVTATGAGGEVSAPATTTATVERTDNVVGGWTDAAGVEITSAAAGSTVFLDICTVVEQTQAFQVNVYYDPAVATSSASNSFTDLDASASTVAACSSGAGTDVVDQFTGAGPAPDGSEEYRNFQNFSISSAPGSGTQGVARMEFTIEATAGGSTLVPTFQLQSWGLFSGTRPNQVTSSIPALTITP